MSSPTFDLKPSLVRAGAGAGKTTRLVNLVLEIEKSFRKNEKRHAKLVVSTFTRKATQELKERLLAEALRQQDPDCIEFVQRGSQLHISTIHGVLVLFLSRYGAQSGLSSQFSILSKNQEKRISKKILKDLIQSDPEVALDLSSLLEYCDFDHLLEFLHDFENRFLQSPIKVFQKQDLEDHLKLQVRQTQTEIEDLLASLTAVTRSASWETYFSALGLLWNQLQDNEILSDQVRILQNFLETVDSPRKTKEIPVELADEKNDFQKSLKSYSSFSSSEEFRVLHAELAESFLNLAEIFAKQKIEFKIQQGNLSLSDLETLALKVIEEQPEAVALFANEWDYWLIDEFQDTSPLQVRLIEALRGPKNSFLVGDPQQSIYLFRGARSEVFLRQEKQLELQGGSVEQQMTNYRSRPELLHFFNFIFSKLDSIQFQPMLVGYAKDHKIIEPEPAQIFVSETWEEEIESIVARTQNLLSQGIEPEDICVLSMKKDNLEDLARAYAQFEIPAQIHASGQFHARREIQDARHLLKFLANPHDNLNFLEILRSPFFRVFDQFLQDLPHSGSESYFIRALSLSKEQPEIWKNFIQLKRVYDQAQSQGAVKAWREALVEFLYFEECRAQDPAGRKEANLWKLISEISQAERQPGFSVLSFLSEMQAPSTEGDGEQEATPVIEPAKVQLMTVHASKGLQFPHVLVIGLGKKAKSPATEFILWSEDSRLTLSLLDPEEQKMMASGIGQKLLQEQKSREAAEKLRVFYVALTRAQLSVSLFWSKPDSSSLAALIQNAIVVTPDSQLIRVAETSYRVSPGLKATPVQISNSEKLKNKVRPLFADLKVSTDPKNIREMASVTGLLSESLSSSSRESVSAQQSFKALQKALMGVEIHRAFEAVKYQQDLRSETPRVQQALRFLKSYESGEILKWIESGFVEWGFAILKNQRLIQGQIDLWGQKPDGRYFVADYKTGSEEYSETAFEQIEIYAWALRAMGKIPKSEKVDLVVIYPLSETCKSRTALDFEKIDTLLGRKL